MVLALNPFYRQQLEKSRLSNFNAKKTHITYADVEPTAWMRILRLELDWYVGCGMVPCKSTRASRAAGLSLLVVIPAMSE